MVFLIEEYKYFVKNDWFMFCLIDVCVFLGRYKYNLKDSDMNIFVYDILYFGI